VRDQELPVHSAKCSVARPHERNQLFAAVPQADSVVFDPGAREPCGVHRAADEPKKLGLASRRIA